MGSKKQTNSASKDAELNKAKTVATGPSSDKLEAEAEAQAKAEAEAQAKAEAEGKAEVEGKIPVFTVGDKNYTFSNRCPERLQINGDVYTKAEILEDEDLIEFLVIGNSPFVTLHF